ncbi:hypothetical protein JQS43_21905 [Natronosporangium hydrolyticum]|uniref:DUF4760 domain-containing protein n=1 Tax=Natronosporangium hydrolyticum TaxID=2811111 RepID=A0A895Y9X8_9ACTN|nr:hypothetical protein [Natronosporangium hydrolyticum]QSB14151.1 hypothetical protein JQS43_21905 [Natronosporangium hydrolyticum]
MKAKKETSKAQLTVAVLIVVALLLLIGAFLFSALRFFVRADPTVVAAMMGASATVIVATLTVVGGRVFERKKAIEAEQRTQWAKLYEEFIREWLKIMQLNIPKEKRVEKVDDSAVVEYFANFSAKAMPWASAQVLNQWIAFRQLTVQGSAGDKGRGKQLLFEWEKLILAMRRDLGHKDKSLDDHQILKMFINDLDESIGKKEETQSQPERAG